MTRSGSLAIDGDPERFVLREPLHRHLPNGLVLETQQAGWRVARLFRACRRWYRSVTKTFVSAGKPPAILP
jgi:hypothetical protein